MNRNDLIELMVQGFINGAAKHAGDEPEQVAQLDDDSRSVMFAAMSAALSIIDQAGMVIVRKDGGEAGSIYLKLLFPHLTEVLAKDIARNFVDAASLQEKGR